MQPVRRPTIFRAAVAILMTSAAVCVAAERLTFTFDEHAAGTPPAGFFFAGARQASGGMWEVRGTGTRRHLIHVADPTVVLKGIAVAGVSSAAPADIALSARLHLIDGDRAAGLVWRYLDANNFYALGIDLSSRSTTLFRVSGGNRIRLDSATDINLDPNVWHTVGIVQQGDQVRAHIDGIGVLRARDRTLTEGGRAGVWSAGNSTTWFDDLTIEEYLEPR